jgi:magnesium chelatase subunit H
MSAATQEIDSVEYGLTDIQEYYANTGALKRAAQVGGSHEQQVAAAGVGGPPPSSSQPKLRFLQYCTPHTLISVPALPCLLQAARPGAKVGCSIVEAFSKDVRPRELEEVLRLEYRSKLLNPK